MATAFGDGSASSLMSRAAVSAKIADELRDVERQLKALDRESRAAKKAQQRPRPHSSQGARSNRARSAWHDARLGSAKLTHVRGSKAAPAPTTLAVPAETQRPATSSGTRRRCYRLRSG